MNVHLINCHCSRGLISEDLRVHDQPESVASYGDAQVLLRALCGLKMLEHSKIQSSSRLTQRLLRSKAVQALLNWAGVSWAIKFVQRRFLPADSHSPLSCHFVYVTLLCITTS